VVTIVLNAFIGFMQRFRADAAMQALRQLALAQATELRDGVARGAQPAYWCRLMWSCWKPATRSRLTFEWSSWPACRWTSLR
jgi:hypothetical protein